MRLIFFGSGLFGEPTLRALHGAPEHEVALVISQPARPAGRKRTLTPTPIAQCAEELGLPVDTPEDPHEPEVIERVQQINPDAFVVIAYGHKLKPELLDEYLAINLHASLLPKYRGAAPINWAMIHGDRETGLSVITLAQRMDAGEILARVATEIGTQETAGELHDRLAAMGPDLVLKVLRDEETGRIAPVEQDESRASSARKLTKADGTARFDQPADMVRARVHGLTPWPGCAVKFGEHTVKLMRVRVKERNEVEETPGTLRLDGTIACRPGTIEILEIQPPGGRIMSMESFRHGHRCEPGMVLEPV
ncbi:MAG: methionyl-tRNA formyltransferase [Phycisphaerales bacterium]|nr:MAG: methionyl-tRNA formyltransferase [Phycisphaerales bacterium]